MFKDKVLLITGGGSLGTELIRVLLKKEVKGIRVFDNSEQQLYNCELEFRGDPRVSYLLGDVGDYDAVEMALPGVNFLIHTAACKFVNYVEYHPFQSIRTNVDGTTNIIKAVMREASVEKAINISSDKACNPCNIYGLTKALQERLFIWADRSSRKVFCSMRFPNFFGSAGSVIETWKKQASNGLPLTLTDEKMYRYFIEIPDAANRTLEALNKAEGGEIYIPADLEEKNMKDLMLEYGSEFEIIGRRSGERLHEVLMTEAEKDMATMEGNLWKIDTKKDYLGTPHYLYDTYRRG